MNQIRTLTPPPSEDLADALKQNESDPHQGATASSEEGQERWLPIEAAPNYDVSTLGNVRRRQTAMLIKPSISHKGYRTVGLNNKTIRIGRAVALAFIPNPQNKSQVNHIDGDKQNDRITNLEWTTQSENQLHASYSLGKKVGQKSPQSTITDDQVILARTVLHKTMNNKQIADHFGVGVESMHRAIAGDTWKHLNGLYPPVRRLRPYKARLALNLPPQ
jgi:hypothetical protein